MSGYIIISRAIWQDTDFRDSEMTQREALIWMVAHAAWKPHSARVGNAVVHLERGQISHSTRYFAKAFGWSESRVRRYFDVLKNRRTIDAVTDAGVTVITLCNYDKYQTGARFTDAPRKPEPTQHRRTTDADKNTRNTFNTNNPSSTASPARGPDERKDAVNRILSVTGMGMADPSRSPNVTLSLARRVDQWLDAWDMDLDILPVVQAKTEKARANPLYSYQILENDIAAHHAKRLQSIPTVEITDAQHSKISAAPKRKGGIIDPDDRSPLDDPFQRAVVGIVQTG